MKKIFYLLMVVGFVFTSCDPLEEIYDEIDASPKTVVGEAEYTLIEDDYSELELDGGFETVDDVKTKLPSYLSELYPVWGKGSSLLINYNMVGGLNDLEDLTAYINADSYKLVMDDYALSGSDVEGFYPDVDPSDFLEDILDGAIDSPEEGKVVLAKYKQYTEVPNIEITTNYSFADNFDYGAATGSLTTLSGGSWVSHSGAADQLQYATTSLSMTGYPSSDIGGSIVMDASGSEDLNSSFIPITSGTVYASTLINITSVADGAYFFHLKDDGFNFSGRVGAKNDGTGKILFGIGASSSTLTYGTTAYDLGTTYLLVASYNIDNGVSNLYILPSAEATEPATPEATNTGDSGRNVESIAIRQKWGGPSATLDGIRVASTWEDLMKDDVATIVTGEKIYRDIYYKYNGSYWSTTSKVYNLTSEDYDSMGTSSGQPGKYNNFDSNVAPNDYIPTFLAFANPYAQEEDEIIVMYKYRYNSKTEVRGNLYTVINGIWSAHSSSLQFGHDGNTWVPDNTIKYTLTSDDYCNLADQLKGEPGYDESLLNDFCFYGNFTYKWEDEQILQTLGLLADSLSPEAEVGQKYLFTYVMYDNGTNDESTKIILEDSGEWVLFE